MLRCEKYSLEPQIEFSQLTLEPVLKEHFSSPCLVVVQLGRDNENHPTFLGRAAYSVKRGRERETLVQLSSHQCDALANG